MKSRSYFLPLLIGSLFLQSFWLKRPTLEDELIGEWKNKSVQIIIKTQHNTDSTGMVKANSANWENVLKMKPIHTTFLRNGTYYSHYRNVKDSVFYRPEGRWRLANDSLFIDQLKPVPVSFHYKLKIKRNLASFHGFIDFDGDGKADDEYLGTQQKLN